MKLPRISLAIALSTILLAALACGGNRESGSLAPAQPAAQSTLEQLPAPSGVQPELWKQLNAELGRVLTALGDREISVVPTDEASRILDLQVAAAAGTGASFSFSYRCSGDYDQNGEVNISDLTPIGIHFHKTNTATDWSAAQLADGDVNGEVNIADVTPIGLHYKSRVDGFELQSASAQDAVQWTSLADIPLSAATPDSSGGYKHIEYLLASTSGDAWYRVVPFNDGSSQRELGIAGTAVFFGASALDAPTDLLASLGTYTDKIALSWTPVSGASSYELFRDDQQTPLATLGDVSSYDDSSVTDTVPHTYWVRCSDGVRVSNFSAPTIGWLGEPVVVTVDPPTNVQASDGAFEDHVTVSWTKSSGATTYEIYRDSQSTPIDSVGDVDTYDDFGLTDTFSHTYWVAALKGLDRSVLSASDTGYMAEPVVGTLDPPTNLQASDGTFNDHVALTWTKTSGATFYDVYRDSQASPLASLGEVDSYDDFSVPDTFAHLYWVSAHNDTEFSDLSLSDFGFLTSTATGTMVVLGYNDLGMHCMNEDFSEMMILPPYNTLHAQIVNRSGGEPRLVNSGVTVEYNIPGNTYSVGKTNFWDYANALLGVTPPDNMGLTGNGLSGTMVQSPLPYPDWVVTGIPLTPIADDGSLNPYQLASIVVKKNGVETAHTQAVTPVSWEISCDICHNTKGISTATDILRKHDWAHGTDLENSKPVTCGTCHAQPELGLAGQPGVPSLSSSMHTAHAPRMYKSGLTNECYACHPGQNTQCLRDIHYTNNMTCTDCHGTMEDVGNPTRTPWVDEPRCDDCHTRPGFDFEQPNTLFRDSIGHHGVHCAACHGSPHAITPTVQPADNIQAIMVQGHPGRIDTCTVCHTDPPDQFEHFVGGD